MSISYILVLLGLGIFGCAVWALFWAIDDGQYDDVEKHARLPLDDEDENGVRPHLLAKGARPAEEDKSSLARR